MPSMASQASARKTIRRRGVEVLRRTHLLPLAEWARMGVVTLRQKRDNVQFLQENPGFVPPPAALMHDAYGDVSYRCYLRDGAIEADMLAGLIREHHPAATRVL